MAHNKIEFGGKTLIDLTGDTVVKDALVVGYTAHGADGEPVAGANPYEKAATDTTVQTQADLIEQIKTALEGKAAGGGVQLPTLDNPGSAEDLASGKQLIGADGEVVTGTIVVKGEGESSGYANGTVATFGGDAWAGKAVATYTIDKGQILYRKGVTIGIGVPLADFGDAQPSDVTAGKIFTSAAGLRAVGTGGGGMVVRSGSITNGNSINTGLSDVEHFIIYKETQTATGLIHLHYNKSGTSRMYASAWSTQNYGTKTITIGTGGVTVSGGTVTISATQAAQGALTSGVTYKWIAIGTA